MRPQSPVFFLYEHHRQEPLPPSPHHFMPNILSGLGSDRRSAFDRFPSPYFSEAIMKAILSMALVLGVCGLAGAADDKGADPVGTWKCEYEIGGQQRTSTLKIKKDGDNLTGTMSWPDQDETKLK